MAMFFLFLIILFFVIGSMTGRLLNLLPLILIAAVLFMLSFGISVLGWLIANPLILLILLGIYFYNRGKRPKQQRRSGFYYHSTGNSKDFEEFFRRASNGGFQYGEGGGYYNQSGTGFGNIRDRDEDYRNLGIQKGATKEEVKKAYREKAKQHHPDRFVNAGETVREEHEKIFKTVNESYENIMKDFQ